LGNLPYPNTIYCANESQADTPKKQLKEKWYPMNMFSRFFEFGYVDKKIRKDGIIQEREYYVIFDTILGELFVHNLLTKNYDWFDNSFYSLPESAQLFYRQFLVHHDFKMIPLNLDTIVTKMGFQDKNITNLINSFENNTLGPLQTAGFIISYEQEEGLFGKKYIIRKPPKKRKKNA
jgi:hypothetical protein